MPFERYLFRGGVSCDSALACVLQRSATVLTENTVPLDAATTNLAELADHATRTTRRGESAFRAARRYRRGIAVQPDTAGYALTLQLHCVAVDWCARASRRLDGRDQLLLPSSEHRAPIFGGATGTRRARGAAGRIHNPG